MLFTDIRLQNYRSYTDASFELSSGVNIVVGPNAAGKTNLLEALMVAATGKSYRARDHVLIKLDQDWLRLDVHTADNQTRVVKIQKNSLGKTEKTFEIDEKPYKRLGIHTKQPVVLFQPDDLRLLHAEPQARREYLDDFLEQYTPGYTTLRSSLRRVISQRNALLKQQHTGSSQLFAWNIRLCDIASQLIDKRIGLIAEINQKIDAIYSAISSSDMNVRLDYSSKTPLEGYSDNLMKELQSREETDRLRGFTSRGPHRDDIIAHFGETPLSDAASRGENRTFMLGLKIIELQILEEQTGKRPLLLLDDVFSELDGSRRRALTKFLQDYQTVITTTDADIVSQGFAEKAAMLTLQPTWDY